jgi:hypothetical protein
MLVFEVKQRTDFILLHINPFFLHQFVIKNPFFLHQFVVVSNNNQDINLSVRMMNMVIEIANQEFVKVILLKL